MKIKGRKKGRRKEKEDKTATKSPLSDPRCADALVIFGCSWSGRCCQRMEALLKTMLLPCAGHYYFAQDTRSRVCGRKEAKQCPDVDIADDVGAT